MDFDAAYKIEGYPGIAWRVISYRTYEDEDFEWSGILAVDHTQVKAHMIGDDRTFEFDIEDIIKIRDDEYCPECGQIGCKATQFE